jgi:hypothetical protein
MKEKWYYRILDSYAVEATTVAPGESFDPLAEGWSGPHPSEAAAMREAESIIWVELEKIRRARRKLHQQIAYVTRRDRAKEAA